MSTDHICQTCGSPTFGCERNRCEGCALLTHTLMHTHGIDLRQLTKVIRHQVREALREAAEEK